jgi:hypothetical protein
MNTYQHDALLIFSLLSYHTSTCFGRISNPSSGGIMYIVANGNFYIFELTVVSGLGKPADSQLNKLKINSASGCLLLIYCSGVTV